LLIYGIKKLKLAWIVSRDTPTTCYWSLIQLPVKCWTRHCRRIGSGISHCWLWV